TPGFVWRYIDESGNSTSTRPYADPRIAISGGRPLSNLSSKLTAGVASAAAATSSVGGAASVGGCRLSSFSNRLATAVILAFVCRDHRKQRRRRGVGIVGVVFDCSRVRVQQLIGLIGLVVTQWVAQDFAATKIDLNQKLLRCRCY